MISRVLKIPHMNHVNIYLKEVHVYMFRYRFITNYIGDSYIPVDVVCRNILLQSTVRLKGITAILFCVEFF